MCSDRTISRDRKSIQEASALTPDPAFAPVMAGRLLTQMQTAIEHIRRVTRDRETPAQMKIDGEHRCYQIFSDFVQRLQSLGYLPTAATRLEADLTHHLGEVPSYEQQGEEIRRIRALVSEGMPIAGELDQLQETVERAALSQQVINIENQVNKETDHDHTD